MKNRGYYIAKIISIAVVVIFLLNIFVGTPQVFNRIIILPYITKFISGYIPPYIFMYNITRNIVALMPFAFFLPILFKKSKV